MHPRVSVVIPFFNPGYFLEDAINSILWQTYDDWELLLVNDGSSDSSVDIAIYFSNAYPDKIFHLWHPDSQNHGMAASRNLGAIHARGEYLAHLDADDMYLPDKLSFQVQLLDSFSEVAMVFGPMVIWSSWCNIPDTLQSYTIQANSLFASRGFIRPLLSGRNDPAGYLIRKSIFECLGGYPEEFWMCEDWALYIKVNLEYPIYVYSRHDYLYRQHSSQSCTVSRRDRSFYRKFRPFLSWLVTYTNPFTANDIRLALIIYFAVFRFYVLAFLESTCLFSFAVKIL